MTRSNARSAAVAAFSAILTAAAVLGMAAPAQAAPDTLIILTPVNGDTTETRTVTIAGTGTPGASVALVDGAPISGAVPVPYGAAVVAPDATWTFDVVFDDDAAETQVVQAVQIDLADPVDVAAGDEMVTFSLPAPITAPAVLPIIVTSPADNSTVSSRIVSITGTVPVGSALVNTLDDGTVQLPAPVIDSTGAFVALGLVPFGGSDTRTFTLTGSDSVGAAFTPVSITVTVPAAIAAPVITTPLDGSVVSTTQLTIGGTGVSGAHVVALILPADQGTLSSLAMSNAMSNATPIVVDSSGRWRSTLTIAPGNFIAVAVHTTAPSGGAPVEARSLPSEVIRFGVVPPVVVAQLANTGTDPIAIAGVGGGILAFGVMLMLVRRSRLRLPSIR